MSGRQVRSPRPALVGPGTLCASALLASPVLWLLGEGLVSVTDVLVRYLLVLAGCVAVTVAVRASWPALSGNGEPPGPDPEGPDRAAVPAESAEPAGPAVDQTRS